MNNETWVNPFNDDGSINESLVPKSLKQKDLELNTDSTGHVDPTNFTLWLKDQGFNVTQIGPSNSEEGNNYNIDDAPDQANDNDNFYL